MKPERIFIVAGNLHQFAYYKQKKWKTFKETAADDEVFPDYIYVRNLDAIRGMTSIKGFYIGTYYDRADIEDIKTHIATIKLREEYVKSKVDELETAIDDYKKQFTLI